MPLMPLSPELRLGAAVVKGRPSPAEPAVESSYCFSAFFSTTGAGFSL